MDWPWARLIHLAKANTPTRTTTTPLKSGRSREALARCGTADDEDAPGRAAAITGIATSIKIGMWRTASKAAQAVRSRGTITRHFGRERELASAARSSSHPNKSG